MRLANIFLALVLLAVTVGGCTTTYTESDLVAEGRKEEAAVESEDVGAVEVEEAGGANEELFDEEAEGVIRDADL